MLLAVLLTSEGAIVAGVSADAVIADILPALGATSLADLDWASNTELYQWADEAVKRLSHRCGVFVERDTSTTTVSGTSQYPTPAGHIDTIHVTLNSLPPLPLRATTVAELEALDGNWATTVGGVGRFSMDADGTGFITLYQVPVLGGQSLTWIFHQFPPVEITTGSTVDVPSPMGDYLAYAMVGEARRKESDRAMPEVAEHCDQMMALMEEVACAYWGPGQ
ncbi:MAG TPA: hypothetical protein VK752_05180 [Bryobacteraceae bacterium]|nr:hypothetical protein [Bryobacteraceae bacterium]